MVIKSPQNLENLKFSQKKDNLVFVDDCGIIQFSNTKFNNSFGYEQNYLFKKNISVVFPKNYSNIIYTYIYRCMNNSNLKLEECVLIHKNNNQIVPISLQFKKFTFLGIKGVLLIIKKSTDAKNIATKKVNSFYKEHINFIAKTSHELRNPLTTILNATNLLEKIKGTTQNLSLQEKNFNRIKKSIAHLTKILDDFLVINKIELNNKEQTTKTNLPQFTNEIIQSSKGENLKSIFITYKHNGIADINVDKDMLYSIFHNLLSNAIKYSPNNSIINFETKINKNTLTVICKDNGIGIPNEDKNKLFTRYFRAKNTTSIQGTGLGLCIIKDHLKKIGGKIDFISKINYGTTFFVKIPLIKQHAAKQIF